jgi:hypothetical protein
MVQYAQDMAISAANTKLKGLQDEVSAALGDTIGDFVQEAVINVGDKLADSVPVAMKDLVDLSGTDIPQQARDLVRGVVTDKANPNFQIAERKHDTGAAAMSDDDSGASNDIGAQLVPSASSSSSSSSANRGLIKDGVSFNARTRDTCHFYLLKSESSLRPKTRTIQFNLVLSKSEGTSARMTICRCDPKYAGPALILYDGPLICKSRTS